MSNQWKQKRVNKKRKKKPTPSPTNIEETFKKYKQNDKRADNKTDNKSVCETDGADAAHDVLTDSLPYLNNLDNHTDSLGSPKSSVSEEKAYINNPQPTIMSTPVNSDDLLDLSVNQSQSILTGVAPVYEGSAVLANPVSAPMSNVPNLQPVHQMVLGGMSSPMIPMTPMNQMQGSGIFTPGPPMQNTLTEDDILKVALKVKSLMITEINELINLKVEEATSYLRKDINSLRSENAQLKDDLNKLEKKCTTDIDALEQYSRRSCLRIGGIPEIDNESTDKIVLDLANKLKANVNVHDIDRSHRVGRPREHQMGSTDPPKPREIIVKFSNTKARLELLKARSTLRKSKDKVYINEDLTSLRNELAFKCRALRRAGKIKKVWIYNGNVFINQNNDKRVQVSCESDLKPYGTPHGASSG